MYVLYLVPESPAVEPLLRTAAAAYLAKPLGERDAGLDLYAAATSVPPTHGGPAAKISMQVRAAVFDTERGHFRAYWMLPRSSISKTPLRLANSVGLIDAGYRGTLLAAVDNHSAAAYDVQAGERLVQVSAPDLLPWDDIQVVSEIPGGSTLRGAGGFGSTGLTYFS